jgi:XTP/dITP diphosphohydrolase
MKATGNPDRRARFVCAVSVSDDTGNILRTTTGICPGTLATEPRGTCGFGYDPLFIPDGFDRTFGELDDTVKTRISHRARAFLKIVPFLRGFLAI